MTKSELFKKVLREIYTNKLLLDYKRHRVISTTSLDNVSSSKWILTSNNPNSYINSYNSVSYKLADKLIFNNQLGSQWTHNSGTWGISPSKLITNNIKPYSALSEAELQMLDFSSEIITKADLYPIFNMIEYVTKENGFVLSEYILGRPEFSGVNTTSKFEDLVEFTLKGYEYPFCDLFIEQMVIGNGKLFVEALPI